ncbi:MAG: hypothetical protein GX033_03810 [Firmicutes bacterium]|nr:hypothetical protein [Bacillota bacterium]
MSVAQPLGAFIFVFLGFCFGFFFDLYRVLCRTSAPGQLLTAATDLLFWFTYTVWVYIVLLRVNMGEVRVFLLLCLALGAVIYFFWLSPILLQAWGLVFGFSARVLAWLSRVVEAILRILLWPYRVLLTYLLMPIFNLVLWLFQPLALFNSWLLTTLTRWLAPPRAFVQKIALRIAKLWAGE